MVKKIIGILFIIIAILSLIGSIANGSLFEDRGSTAATYGGFTGTIIPIILFVVSGIFLIVFDSASKSAPAKGFNKRKAQCSGIIVLLVLWSLLAIPVIFAAGINLGTLGNFLSFLMTIIPYLFPVLTFVYMLEVYALPYLACRKHFYSDSTGYEQCLNAGTLVSYSADKKILANNKALIFPELFCAVPFDSIANVKLKKVLWEQDVYFNLTNGKKFYIISKNYNEIMAAINANKI